MRDLHALVEGALVETHIVIPTDDKFTIQSSHLDLVYIINLEIRVLTLYFRGASGRISLSTASQSTF